MLLKAIIKEIDRLNQEMEKILKWQPLKKWFK
jgi:hypothetical protein